MGRSVEIRLHGLVIRVVGLDDIATSKRATGRPKDLQALGEIERLQERASCSTPSLRCRHHHVARRRALRPRRGVAQPDTLRRALLPHGIGPDRQ